MELRMYKRVLRKDGDTKRFSNFVGMPFVKCDWADFLYSAPNHESIAGSKVSNQVCWIFCFDRTRNDTTQPHQNRLPRAVDFKNSLCTLL